MKARFGEVAIVSSGLVYLGLLSWAMGSLSFDIWGALIVAPIYGILGFAIIQRMFRGSHRPVAAALTWGLLIKLGGAASRYWVGFEAYGGGIDAGRYHRYAVDAAGKVWAGEASFVTVLPTGLGTTFIERFTALTYTLTGGSQLAGFVTFAFFAYIGILFFVKAALIAVPSLAARRYAWMCVLFPSIVYWPSSIGKEALMVFSLGIATYGLATMLAHGRWGSPLLTIGFGLGFAAFIRPHIAGIWIAAAVPSLVVALIRRREATTGPRGTPTTNKYGLILVLAVALVGFVLIATATIKFLAPDTDTDTSTADSITEIFEETARRTGQAGSNFDPPSVSNPAQWPYAVVRTLTRPLPFEARGIAQLVSAAEMAVLLGIYALSWRRLLNLPRLFLSTPYITFVISALFLTGLAYSGLANLGILARQKSLVLPFLVLLPCIPVASRSPKNNRSDSTPDASQAMARGTEPRTAVDSRAL